MATPATARRSEPPHPNLDAPQSPLRSAHHTPARTPTPRPSISPLSVASRPAKGSPIATRDATMDASEDHQDAEANNSAINNAAETGDIPDDRSSSLSEPEDDEEEEGRPEYMHEPPKAPGQLVAQKSLDYDSEAETERLEDSPQKQRIQAESTGRTPSKLKHTATADDELSDPPSPLPTGPGAASSTSTAGTAGLKRKRSDEEDSPLTSEASDLGESPRKRSHEAPAEEQENEDAQADANGAEDAEDAPTPAPNETRKQPSTLPNKIVKGKKGVGRGRKAKEQAEASEADTPGDVVEAEEEPSAEAPKSDEEIKQKGEASISFEDLAKQFTAFREGLVNERLASIEQELQMLQQADCTHPEYMRQVVCIDERQAKQVREANAYHRYKMQALRERTLGERAQRHSQYFQTVREAREETLYALGEDWYSIQKERRQQHQDQDEHFLYKFPTKKSAQIRQQAKYNQEVSVLSGVAKYVGFPAAPEMAGVEGGSLEDDFKAMRLPRRIRQTAPQPQPQPQPHHHHHHHPPQQQHQPQQPIHVASATAYSSEQRAHEQFLEQNAWARPQATSIPAQRGTPNLTHTADWVDQPGGARHLIRNLSHGHYGQQPQRNGSPFATPAPKRSMYGDSAAPELSSSALAASQSGEQRLQAHGQNVFHARHSPLQVAKQRQLPQNGEQRDHQGFRNVSGTSTIDAPLSAEKPSNPSSSAEKPHGPPLFNTETSAPLQSFDTSAIHRHAHPNPPSDAPTPREVYANASFRPSEGAFGTPAPMAGNGVGVAGGGPPV